MSTVIVVANGKPLGGWLEVQIDQAHDKVAGQASVKMSEQPGVPMPIKLGDKVQVLIDGRSVIKGHVHEFIGTMDYNSHDMTVTIRDQTQDVIDSTVGPNLKLKSPISLKQIAERTLGTMGLGHIKVIDKVGPDIFQQGEQISASIDDRGFRFLDQWAQKRQVLLNTDGEGNIVIDRNLKERAPVGAVLISRYQDTSLNNVKKSQFRNSDLDRHNSIAVNGQKSTNDKDHWEAKSKDEATAQADPLQKNWGVAHDTSIRPERKLHGRGAKGLSQSTPHKAAKWRSSAARAHGYQYVATVDGFYGSTGWLWWHGFMVPVLDEHWDIEAELMISDVRFIKTWTGGEITEITLTLPDAYTTEEEGSPSDFRTGRFGAGSAAPGSYRAAQEVGITS